MLMILHEIVLVDEVVVVYEPDGCKQPDRLLGKRLTTHLNCASGTEIKLDSCFRWNDGQDVGRVSAA